MWGSDERRSWTLSARKTLARTSRAKAARRAPGACAVCVSERPFELFLNTPPPSLHGLMEETAQGKGGCFL